MTWPAPLPVGTAHAEHEPEGFGDAVQAAACMLAVMTSLTWVGFEWQRNGERAAHQFAIELVERVARRGEGALVPVWSGFGRGPASPAARRTFRALQARGDLVSAFPGRCRVASRASLCRGTRYDCRISGATPAGPVTAVVGLCRPGSDAPYTFDTFDLTLPATGGDRGNRAEVDAWRDGLIRYGTVPLPADVLPARSRFRAPPPWP